MTSLRRVKFRKGLSEMYLPYYDALCEHMPEGWEPYQGLRAFAYQDSLFAQGRSNPGPIVTNARAGESPHNYGCASDWTPFDTYGHPIWLQETDPLWKVYWNVIEKIGAKSGAEFGDRPHNELKISKSWKHDVHPVYVSQGFQAAQDFIAKHII